MTKIKLPIANLGKCQKCGYIMQYMFNEYGALESCVQCDAAPSEIKMMRGIK